MALDKLVQDSTSSKMVEVMTVFRARMVKSFFRMKNFVMSYTEVQQDLQQLRDGVVLRLFKLNLRFVLEFAVTFKDRERVSVVRYRGRGEVMSELMLREDFHTFKF